MVDGKSVAGRRLTPLTKKVEQSNIGRGGREALIRMGLPVYRFSKKAVYVDPAEFDAYLETFRQIAGKGQESTAAGAA